MAVLAPLRRTAPRWRTLRQVAVTGMRDSYDATTGHPKKLYLLQNAYPQNAEVGGGIVGRPGFRWFGARLGAGADRTGQGIFQFTKQDGTEYTIVFCGSLMYSLDHTARTATLIAYGGGVVVDPSAKLYGVTFNDQLVVSDGVHVPWMWDGTTFTSLVNCPVLYGQPVVHYGKLLGIKAADRLAIVWSEELDATVGYEMAAYDNIWILGQSEQERLYALVAMNDALYYFRARSTGAIYGAVSDDWQTTGVRDGVSETLGTTSPDGIVARNNEIFFIDADGRPHLIISGGSPRDMWEDFAETIKSIPRASLHTAVGIDWLPGDRVIFWIPGLGATMPNTGLVFHPRTLEAQAIWRGFTFAAAAMVKDQALRPIFMHITNDGYLYDHARPEDSVPNDEFWDGARPIAHVVQATPQGWSLDRELDFTELRMSLRPRSTMTLLVDYETPRRTSSYQTVVVSGGDAIYGLSRYGTARYAKPTVEVFRTVGIKARGRWIKPRIRHETLNEHFGFLAWEAGGYEVAAGPRVR